MNYIIFIFMNIYFLEWWIYFNCIFRKNLENILERERERVINIKNRKRNLGIFIYYFEIFKTYISS